MSMRWDLDRIHEEIWRVLWDVAFRHAERYNRYGPYYCCGPSKRWPTPWRVYVEKEYCK
jgi:hypothetical protein